MTMNLRSPIFDGIRIPSRVGAKQIGDSMCQVAGIDPDLVRTQAYRGRKGRADIEALRIKIAARMVSCHVSTPEILGWFEGFSAETIFRWAREAKTREGIDA